MCRMNKPLWRGTGCTGSVARSLSAVHVALCGFCCVACNCKSANATQGDERKLNAESHLKIKPDVCARKVTENIVRGIAQEKHAHTLS